jgi:hypothetical protein
MAGIRPRFEKGSPLSFNANVLIKGGQLVEPDAATGRIKPSTANSVKVLGVALGDASAFGYTNANTADAWGNPVVNAQYPPNEVAVAKHGVFDLKVAAATTALAFGDLVKAAANGEVQLHSQGAAATYDMIVGRCVETAGIPVGETGKIRLGGV